MAIDLSGFVKRRTTIKIGMENFTFTELSLADLAEFRAEMTKKREAYNEKRRKRIVEESKELKGLDQLELLKYLDTPLTDEEIENSIETVEGLGLLALFSLRHKHLGISRQQVLDIITPGILPEVTKALFPESEIAKKEDTSDEKKSPKLAGQPQ